jgi:hypothetical protein
VTWRGTRRSWAEHIAGSGSGYTDEVEVVQPVAFRQFAEELLGFTVGETLAPEQHEEGTKPDFTPADAVTHPFVFEVKSTREGVELPGHAEQVRAYLRRGGRRIREVLLTNLVGARVFTLNDRGELTTSLTVNLRGLLTGPEDIIAVVSDARGLAELLERFRFQSLSRAEKLARVRQAPDWNPVVEVTDPAWLSRRLDRVVEILRTDVRSQLQGGALNDVALVPLSDRLSITDELRELEWRLGGTAPAESERDLDGFVAASPESDASKALLQYEGHVAYYSATRLLLVRIWEDLGLLEPVLYNGGFDEWMRRFDDVLSDVVDHSFNRAERRYPSLFNQRNTYTWFEPGTDAYADAIYELANTYVGAIESDVLGTVYERLLERVDRKLLGQYYTPRDIIRLIWDLIDLEAVVEANEDRTPRILDIATGSGGFLVEAGRRLRERTQAQLDAGARIQPGRWVAALADGLTGIEVQRFPAYLAELNLLIQIGLVRQSLSFRTSGAGVGPGCLDFQDFWKGRLRGLTLAILRGDEHPAELGEHVGH